MPVITGGFGAAQRFHAEHGHLRPAAGWCDTRTGIRLAGWLRTQRVNARAGLLSAERRTALDALGMPWTLKPTPRRWADAYALAQAFHAEHGHLDVTPGTTLDGVDLYHWVARQRHLHLNAALSAERVHALNRLGMRWQLADPWETGYQAAAAFRARHGHLDVRVKYTDPDTGHKLGTWISKQRGRAATLDSDRRDRLDALGMIWRAEWHDERWRDGLAHTTAHHTEHGNLDVAKNYRTPTRFPLGAWLESRRNEHRSGTLAPDKTTALDALDMIWTTREEHRWETAYTHAVAYHAQHGHLDTPHNHRTPDGFRLGSWVLHQRQLHNGVKPGGLTDTRTTRLTALGMRWSNTRPTARRSANPTPDQTGIHHSAWRQPARVS
jgi:hypothetical protein